MNVGDRVKVEMELTITDITQNPKDSAYDFVSGRVMLGGSYEKTDGTKKPRNLFVTGIPLKNCSEIS